MQKLNFKEKRVLDFIRAISDDRGIPPSVRDIQEAFHYKSPSTVQMYLDRLVNAGYLIRDKGKKRSVRLPEGERGIPLIGTVTAGQPILAEEAFEGYVDFNHALSGYQKSNLFALHIKGESMIDAGILDGDIVIVDRRDYADNGEIVVAMVENEATVKEFYKENGCYRLQPRNQTMSPIIAMQVQILGKVIAVTRYY